MKPMVLLRLMGWILIIRAVALVVAVIIPINLIPILMMLAAWQQRKRNYPDYKVS